METIGSEIVIDIPVEKKKCPICFDDDFEAEQMFSVDIWGHEFCVECVKRYIEEQLLEGRVLRCPHYQCKSMLSLRSCVELLTPKLKEMWERRIEEESVPISERIYCPNPKCSALMSKTELLKSNGVKSRRCVICGKLFCVNCKVPWHYNLSCNGYKRLRRNFTADDIKLEVLAIEKLWRRCGKCQRMLERSDGCNQITCRCGYSFCYKCGKQWKEGGCPHPEEMNAPLSTGICCAAFLFVILIIMIVETYD